MVTEVRVWWKIEGVDRIFERPFPANATWNRVVEYIHDNCLRSACPPCPQTSTYAARTLTARRCLASLTVCRFLHFCSCPQLKPFGAKEEDDEVDYGQEVGDGEAPKTSKTQPLQVTFTPTAQPVGALSRPCGWLFF